MAEGWDYQKAGLNLELYAETMAGIQPWLARTWDRRVVPPPFPPRKGGKGSGGFASVFDLNPEGKYKHPLLVSCTDGVGSKLKIAQLMNRFDTVGLDLVAMSVNDLICTGGEPLVFLDYLAMHADDPKLTAELVKGISDGCVQAGCALVGGETAILPDFYAPGDFDLAGFCSGVVEKDLLIDGTRITPGDVILGLASSGIHSNGYSLVRKVVFEAAKCNVNDSVPELNGTVGDTLLTPTTIYVKPIRTVLEHCPPKSIHGLANITGGGVPDNLGRILPPNVNAVLQRGSWPIPPVFPWLQKLGQIAQPEMDRVFNNGLGFLIVCAPTDVAMVQQILQQSSIPCWPVGTISPGEAKVLWQ
jgi:phosphoribosylformylglycinamidine cyclo-ligase